MAVAGSQLFFVADDGAHGRELWVTDGTAQGSRLVVDLTPGLNGSNPYNLLALGNKVLFTINNSSTGDGEPWVSDGTAAGTLQIADIEPGPPASEPAFLGRIGSIALFSAGTSALGRELWRTDGTPAGTSLVADLHPGAGSSLPDTIPPFPRSPYAVVNGSRLFFAADDGTHGVELWVSDGTAAGTGLVLDIHPSGDSRPHYFVPFGTGVVFSAEDGTHGFEPWASDGTPGGTGLLADIRPGSTNSGTSDLTLGGGRIYFRADDGVHGKELWSTDGTPPGTALVADIHPGAVNGFSTLLPPTGFVGSNLLFFADDGAHGVELWKTDGSGGGTALLADLNPGTGSAYFFNGPSDAQNSVVVGGLWYFTAYTAGSDFEIWTSDGTAAGTRKLKEINDQATSFPFFTFVGTLFGTRLLGDLGGTLLFGADDGPARFDLTRTDGTAAGTAKVSDGTPGTASYFPSYFTPLGGALLYSGEDGVHGSELWRSDGTSAGTFMIKDLDPASSSSTGLPRWMTVLGSKVVFAGPIEALWTTDGTNPGTQPVGASVHLVGPPLPFGGALLFDGADSSGNELWRTDGTLAGTTRLLDIAAGPDSSSPSPLISAGGFAYFSAATPATGRELWKTDGTPAGTSLVKDILPGPGDGASLGESTEEVFFGTTWAALGNRVLFPGDDGISGEEPWISDGTSSGTLPLTDLHPGAQGSEPRWITAAAGRIFFAADDGTHGRELWVTDGTPGGTELLADLEPGPGSSVPMDLRAIGRILLYSAWDSAHGRELWVSDGTAAGTRRVQDIAPGASSASPMAMFASGPKVYFVANDSTTGFELWALPKGALGSALSATKTVGGFLYEGGTVTYTIVLHNDGPTSQPDASGAELTDVLPAGLALIGASATAGTVATDFGTRTVTWNGSLSFGASVTVTITATIQAGTLGSGFANQATLRWDADADGVNEASGVSDDPATPAGGDPTAIVIGPLALGFHTVAPCRVVDTRTGTPLSFGVARTFDVAGTCGIPATARAVAANLTVVDATAPGTLVVWEAGSPTPGTSNINFKVGSVRGNNAILSLGEGAVEALATAGAGGWVQLLLDVSGYFQ
jgi:uncharacterized repeat protein (TIGR01451 family)